MRDPRPPELHPERPIRSDFARSDFGARFGRGGVSYRTRRLLTISLLAGVLSAGLYGLVHHFATETPEEIPTLTADGAYKQKPDQPGGINIPHQDVEVYQKLSTDTKNGKPTVEHLLPPPEAPAPVPPPLPPATTAPTLTNIAPAPAAAPIIPTTTVKPTPPSAPVHTVEKPVTKAHDKTVQSTGAVAVQLASVANESAAEATLERLQTKYAPLLGGTHLHLVKADLAGKGTTYRIQSPPLTEVKATSLCAAIKQQNAGCILVRH